MTTANQVFHKSEAVIELLVNELVASPYNTRSIREDDKLRELADSIKLNGVQQPIIVREIAIEGDVVDYEIVAGHRRWMASQLAGKLTIPAIFRELTNDQARELNMLENLQREDLPAMEEAEAFGALFESLGSAAAVAMKCSKSIDYVARRLKLLDLIDPAKHALGGQLITVDHAMLIARLGESEQEKALRYTISPNAGVKEKTADILAAASKRLASYGVRVDDSDAEDEDEDDLDDEDEGVGYSFMDSHKWEPESVPKLKAFIERAKLDLARAPWDLADANLVPAAGACTQCSANTAHNTALFGDLLIVEASCTRAACFEEKRQAFVTLQAEALKSAGTDALQLSWKSTTVKPRWAKDGKGPDFKQVFKQGQWIQAKEKECGFVHAGVTVDFNDPGWGGGKLRKPGETLKVCVASGCKVHRKEWEKPKSDSGRQERVDPAEQKRRQEEQAFLEKEETILRGKVFGAIIKGLDPSKGCILVSSSDRDAAAWRKKLLELRPGLSGLELEALTIFCTRFDGEARPNSYWMMQKGGIANDRKRLWDLAKGASVDADQVIAKHYHDAGSIAPAADKLYPKGIPWPKVGATAQSTAAKKGVKPAKKKAPAKKAVAKKAVKKAAKKAVKK
jgi:ParB/RepB/Spo0J family partition protein